MDTKNPDNYMDLIDLDLPGWVNWLAQDADGQWWGYEVEPHQHHQGWYENELGRHIKTNKTAANQDWKNSLQKRVRKI